MFKLVLLFALLALSGCASREVAHQAMLGTWRPNATLTVNSMNSVEGITPEERTRVEAYFSGSLIVEIGENKAQKIDLKGNLAYEAREYEVLEVTDKFIRTRNWGGFFSGLKELTIYLEGECIYVLNQEWTFREYYCRYDS